MQSDQLADNEHAKGDKDVNLDTIIKHHEKMQDKIAEEMLMLAANLKENARTANRIVKEDIKVFKNCTVKDYIKITLNGVYTNDINI